MRRLLRLITDPITWVEIMGLCAYLFVAGVLLHGVVTLPRGEALGALLLLGATTAAAIAAFLTCEDVRR